MSGSLAGVLSSARRLSAQDRGCFFGGGREESPCAESRHNGEQSPQRPLPYSYTVTRAGSLSLRRLERVKSRRKKGSKNREKASKAIGKRMLVLSLSTHRPHEDF